MREEETGKKGSETGVERTNTVVVRGQGQRMGIPSRRDPYAIEVDQGRNCYACRGFGHIARYCRNWGQRGKVAEERRLEYRRGGIEGNLQYSDNLKEMENLKSLD